MDIKWFQVLSFNCWSLHREVKSIESFRVSVHTLLRPSQVPREVSTALEEGHFLEHVVHSFMLGILLAPNLALIYFFKAAQIFLEEK